MYGAAARPPVAATLQIFQFITKQSWSVAQWGSRNVRQFRLRSSRGCTAHGQGLVPEGVGQFSCAHRDGVAALGPVHANAAASPLNVEEGLTSDPCRHQQAPQTRVEKAHARDLAVLGRGVVILAFESP